MQVPSGRYFNQIDLAVVREMARVQFVRWSDRPFTLASGIESHVYVFGREDLTDNPKAEWLIGRKIAQIVYQNTDADEIRQQCLIGVPVAGGTLAQAAAMASLEEHKNCLGTAQPIAHRVMREQKKKHGAHQTWVNGRPDLSRHQYWFIDNVVTNGDSKIVVANRAQEDGYPSRQMTCLIWIDRQQGALPRLKATGFEKVVVAYELLDLTFAFGELGLWPKNAVTLVEAEIKAHQFTTSER